MTGTGTGELHVGPRIATRALLREAWLTIAARPARVLLTAAASSLGIGILVLVMGLTATAARQVAADFDALRATQVTASPSNGEGQAPSSPQLERLLGLNGVRAAGVLRTGRSTAVHKLEPGQGPAAQADVVIASAGALDALEVNVAVGTAYARIHDERGSNVALVGRRVARDLGGLLVDGRATVLLQGQRYTVAGIIGDTPRRATLVHAIVIPSREQTVDLGVPQIIVLTEPGAAQTIAQQTPVALDPQRPDAWTASAPPDPDTLRTQIETEVRSTLVAVAVAVLVVAALSIANATFVSVLERKTEIGVRRALGATSGHIRLQVLTEAGLIGAIGGIAGVALALIALAAVSAVQLWQPVIDPLAPLVAPVLGLVVGLLSGIVPALHASRVQPIEAMRNG